METTLSASDGAAATSPFLDPTYMDLARQEMGVMIEAMLSFLPPGSRRREDLVEYRLIGPFRRPTTLPIEIGAR